LKIDVWKLFVIVSNPMIGRVVADIVPDCCKMTMNLGTGLVCLGI
jgi:hypothetical protein